MQPSQIFHKVFFRKAVCLPVVAMLALPVAGQQEPKSTTQGRDAGSRGMGDQGNTEIGSGPLGATTGSSDSRARKGGSSNLAETDREMIEDLAEANMAEIETSKLALEKSKDQQITRFAQQMIDDHTKALNDLRAVAQNKAVQVPNAPDFAHKAMATALRATTGDFFDKEYIKHVGVGDHRRTVDLLEKIQREAKDPDLKSYAAKVLPVVQHHLTMARAMNKQK